MRRALGEVAGLQAVENVLELRQHLLSHVLGARLRQLLDVLQHLVEVLLGDELIAVLLVLRRHIALFLRLAGERLEVAGERGAQLIDQALDLLRRGVLLEPLGQRVLRRLYVALGLGQVAVLDAQRHRPQLVDHAGDARARVVARQPPIGVAQRQIDEAVVDDLLAAQGQRLERAGDAFDRVRLAHQALPLFDHRLSKRLGEGALGQHEFVRYALP